MDILKTVTMYLKLHKKKSYIFQISRSYNIAVNEFSFHSNSPNLQTKQENCKGQGITFPFTTPTCTLGQIEIGMPYNENYSLITFMRYPCNVSLHFNAHQNPPKKNFSSPPSTNDPLTTKSY